MTTGFIKFFKLEGWGKLSIESSSKDVYFSIRNVMPELLSIINSKKYIGEPVTFELEDSSFKSGEKEAININLDFSKRKVGHVVEFDKDKGWGYIEDYMSKQKLFFHYSGIKKDSGKENKYISIEECEPVIYSIIETAKGKNAIDVVLIDKRCYIEFFAVFKDLKSSLIELSKKSETEEWDYLKKKTRGLPVLFSYINQTCKRIFTQNKVIFGKSSKDKTEYAYFNTGLVTSQQDEIFAYFVKNPEYIGYRVFTLS
jgi:cold shock CspA family protein